MLCLQKNSKVRMGRMTRGCDVSLSKQGRKLVSVPVVGTP